MTIYQTRQQNLHNYFLLQITSIKTPQQHREMVDYFIMFDSLKAMNS